MKKFSPTERSAPIVLGFSIYRQRNVSTGLTERALATQPGKRTLSATHDIQSLSSI